MENSGVESDIQRMIEELMRPLNTTHNASTDNTAVLQSLRDIMVMYNSNMTEYNNNVGMSLQLLKDILEERRRSPSHHPPSQRSVPTPSQNTGPRAHDHLFSYTLYRPTIRHEDSAALRRFFQNIVVRPTAEQLNTATELIEFHVSEENANARCPITMDEFQEGDMVRQIRHCSHVFTEEPIQNWFRSNVRCPVCRYDIRDYGSSAGTSDGTNGIGPESSSQSDPSGNIRLPYDVPLASSSMSESNPISVRGQSPQQVTTVRGQSPQQVTTANTIGIHSSLEEIAHNFATDLNAIISENFQQSMNGEVDASHNLMFEFQMETNL